MAAAAANGRKGGHPREVNDADAAKPRSIRDKGLSASDIAKMLAVSRATVFERPADREPEPCGDFRGDTPVDRCHRGYAAVEDDGLLWLCEKLFPFDDEGETTDPDAEERDHPPASEAP